MALKSLPAGIIPEQYAVNSSNPWLHLLEILFPSPYGTYYLARNTVDVQFNGNTYIAFPFEPGTEKLGGEGEIETRTVQVSNVLRGMETALEALEGAVAQRVIWSLVNYKNLSTYTDTDYADFRVTYEIIATEVSVDWVTFTLGSPFINLQRFPMETYSANYCPWVRVFGVADQECNWSSSEDGIDSVNFPNASLLSCDGTLDGENGCSAHNNATNWGGFIGLTQNAMRILT